MRMPGVPRRFFEPEEKPNPQGINQYSGAGGGGGGGGEFEGASGVAAPGGGDTAAVAFRGNPNVAGYQSRNGAKAAERLGIPKDVGSDAAMGLPISPGRLSSAGKAALEGGGKPFSTENRTRKHSDVGDASKISEVYKTTGGDKIASAKDRGEAEGIVETLRAQSIVAGSNGTSPEARNAGNAAGNAERALEQRFGSSGRGAGTKPSRAGSPMGRCAAKLMKVPN